MQGSSMMEQVPSLSLVNTLITECKQGLQDRIYIYYLSTQVVSVWSVKKLFI